MTIHLHIVRKLIYMMYACCMNGRMQKHLPLPTKLVVRTEIVVTWFGMTGIELVFDKTVGKKKNVKYCGPVLKISPIQVVPVKGLFKWYNITLFGGFSTPLPPSYTSSHFFHPPCNITHLRQNMYVKYLTISK